MKKTVLILLLTILAGSARSQDSATYVRSTGKVLEYLRASKFQEVVDLIDPNAKPRPDSSRIGTAWRKLQQSAGPFQAVTDTLYQHQTTYDIVVFRCLFGSRKTDIKTVYGQKGLLKGVFFLPADERERYAPPAYYHPDSIEEVTVDIVNDSIRLKGILTVPKNKGRVPVVILVHGSGPNDKDESVGATKIFRDFSYGFPNSGIAVLRYDKRTRALASMISRKKVILTPEEETISDAVAAVAAVKRDPRIDTTRIFLLGHSMGGYLMPAILEKASEVSGAVLLSPQARPLNQLLIAQSEYVLKNDTSATPMKKSLLDSLKRESAKVEALKPEAKNDSTKIMGMHPAYWLYLKEYDAFTAAKGSSKPLLFVYAGRDYQITAQDENTWKTKMKGRPGTSFLNYKDLNHFYIKGQGVSTPGEYLKAGNVEEKLINDIASWMISGGKGK